MEEEEKSIAQDNDFYVENYPQSLPETLQM